ncbi:unnamed protein product [Blepharisma stoltei]|uniref:Uncharacterized protein n=1 Tax=Blepharisma stoltei TaxID=1481888 RepID=A0AAU9I9B6_9CILI|nr:unnamed protein product [Blepharisma stoltei]
MTLWFKMSKNSDISLQARSDRSTIISTTSTAPTPRSTQFQFKNSPSFYKSSEIASPNNKIFFSFFPIEISASSTIEEVTNLLNSLLKYMISEHLLWDFPDISLLDTSEKINYANRIIKIIKKHIKSKRSGSSNNLNILIRENNSNFKIKDVTFIHNHKSVLDKILDNRSGVHLSKKEAQEFASLIIGASRDSALEDIEKQSSEIGPKLKNEKNRLKYYIKKWNNVKVEEEALINETNYLKAEIKKHKQHIQILQHQLGENINGTQNWDESIEDIETELKYVYEFIESTKIKAES